MARYSTKAIPYRIFDFHSADRAYKRVRFTPKGKEKTPAWDGLCIASAVKKIRRDDDGSITLKLYQTDLVTYFPDGSLKIGSWASKTTADMMNQILPRGVHYSQDSVLTIHAPLPDGEGFQWDDEMSTVYRGRLTLTPEHGGWSVATEGRMAYHYPSLDQAGARRLKRESGYQAFADWYEMCLAHGRVFGEIRYWQANWDAAFALIKEGNFPEAIQLLPVQSDGLDMQKVLYALYQRNGAIRNHEATEMSVGEYRRAKAAANRMRKLAPHDRWGWA